MGVVLLVLCLGVLFPSLPRISRSRLGEGKSYGYLFSRRPCSGPRGWLSPRFGGASCSVGPPRAETLRGFPGGYDSRRSPQSGRAQWMSPLTVRRFSSSLPLELVWRRLASPLGAASRCFRGCFHGRFVGSQFSPPTEGGAQDRAPGALLPVTGTEYHAMRIHPLPIPGFAKGTGT